MTSSAAAPSSSLIGRFIKGRTKASSEPNLAQTAMNSRETLAAPSLSSKMYCLATCSTAHLASSQEEPCGPVTPKANSVKRLVSEPCDIRGRRTPEGAPWSRSVGKDDSLREARAKPKNQKLPHQQQHRYERFGPHTTQGRTLRLVRADEAGVVIEIGRAHV